MSRVLQLLDVIPQRSKTTMRRAIDSYAARDEYTCIKSHHIIAKGDPGVQLQHGCHLAEDRIGQRLEPVATR